MGETLFVPERMIVASAVGVFRRLQGYGQTRPGDLIDRGDIVGFVQSLGVSTPVRTPFDGLLMAIVALDGERVRPGQPVARLRVQ